MNKDQIKFQIKLAKKDGREKEYEYHIGMVENPLPYFRWKQKVELLDKYLALDPHGRRRELDKKIDTLARELGY
jgi:hypothetical protein